MLYFNVLYTFIRSETIFMHVFLFIKFIFAYYQMCFCLLSNVNMIAVKFVIVDSD